MTKGQFAEVIEHIHKCIEKIGKVVDAHVATDHDEHTAIQKRMDSLALAVTAHAKDTAHVRQFAEDLNSKMGAVDAKFDSSITRQIQIFEKLSAVHNLISNGYK